MFRKKVKILYVINDLSIGGAQRIVCNLAFFLSKKYEIHVLNLNFITNNELQKELMRFGIKVVDFKPMFKGDIRAIISIYRSIKKYKIDIVHSHLCMASFFSSCAALFAGVQNIVSTEHNTTIYSSNFWFYKLATNFYLRIGKKIITVSNAIKNIILEKNPSLEKTKVNTIYNGINLHIFDPQRYKHAKKRHLFDKKTVLIGTLMRNDPRKGFLTFSKCADKMKSLKKFQFCAGVNRKWNVTSDNILWIEFENSQDRVAEYLSSLDIFVLPSLEEGLGIVVLEAMAMGIPVIATNVGGIPELIQDGINGLLINPGNEIELEEAILKIYENEMLYEKTSNNGLLKAKSFSIDNMIQNHEKLYDSMMMNN